MSGAPERRRPPREITLRFLAAPTDVAALGGAVHGGRVLEWIDKAAYACAAGWSGTYCVTAFVGDVRFARPIESGHLAEVEATLIHTGRSSMHIACRVSSADPKVGEFAEACSCVVIFVAMDEGRPTPVRPWDPVTEDDRARSELAVRYGVLRADVETAMAEQTYSAEGTATTVVTRFLAAPTDVNWGGKTHGGTVMRWIDEAAYLCGTRWSGGPCISVYAGGVRFYRPIPIGHLVEVEARLLHTGRQTMHVSVHVRSGHPARVDMALTTHCLSVVAALDENGAATEVRPWVPRSDEDRRLDAHARDLRHLRSRMIESAHVD